MQIRNIAIIAHVDHGKTTLVDAMLKQTHTFRLNQKEMGEELILDSNDLEKEKGITILAKNTSVFYKGTKINIIDTPGHADFGGEVERVINMASGALLLVDAVEGPLPQTKFVLKKALEAKLKIIVLINKIDKRDARAKEVLYEIENLFLDLADENSNLNFTTLYSVGRDGKVFFKLPEKYQTEMEGDLAPLFETILREIPDAVSKIDQPFQMLISTLDYDNFIGKLCIGKVTRGRLSKGDPIVLVDEGKILGTYKAQKLATSEGLMRKEVNEVSAGDIVAVAGIPDLTIGQTICDPSYPVSLPKIYIEQPTIKITIGPNTSPLSGRDGLYFSSAQIKKRLLKEKETNLGLKINQSGDSVNFEVCGRGELHLSILIETMKREGYEMEISKPKVIYKTVSGILSEPFEELTLDVDSSYIGVISEELGKRHGELLNMTNVVNNFLVRFVYKVCSQNLIGLRTVLLNKTKGTVSYNAFFIGYFPKKSNSDNFRTGALVATENGKSLSYGLANAQERGMLFVGVDEEIYEGMVVGLSNRAMDIEVNVCKKKKLTNMRSSGADIAVQLTPPVKLSLEQAIGFIAEDELLEVARNNLRIRKKILNATKRKVQKRKEVESGKNIFPV